MMDDCMWCIGESLDACTAYFRADVQTDYEPDGEFPYVADDTALDALVYFDTENGGQRSFREQLDIETAAGGHFPRIFASTEY